jgi:hypothetical protein
VAVSSTALHVVAETAVGLGDGAGSEGGLGAETGLPGATVHVGWPTLDAESIGSSSSGGGSSSSSSSSSGGDGSGGFALPMLASHCPGWVCYAEKTQPQALPYIATGKSGQQVLGAVFKRVFLPGKNIYVVSVQPCFDKKLEASRRDFYDEATGTQDVDLVLSTTELWSLLEHVTTTTTTSATAASASAPEGAGSGDVGYVAIALLRPEFADAPGGRDAHEAMCRCCSVDGRQAILASDSNAGSGAFLEHVFRAAAERLYGVSLWGQPLVYTAGRNADMAEVDLDCQPAAAAAAAADVASATGRRLKFAKAYGFRNIQGVVLKMKQGRAEYDFVEVMACPR